MSFNIDQRTKLKVLGSRLKSIRIAKGLSLLELSYRIDREPQTINRMEMGKVNPTYLTLLIISQGLQVDITLLLEEG
jgi:putative transcriptional regulator